MLPFTPARLPLGIAARLAAAPGGARRRQSGLAAVRWEDGVAHSAFPAIDLRVPATTRLSEYCMRNFDRHGDKIAVVDGVTGKVGCGRRHSPAASLRSRPSALEYRLASLWVLGLSLTELTLARSLAGPLDRSLGKQVTVGRSTT
jgi:hypothetical protein